MSTLLEDVLEAHGGLQRWQQIRSLQAELSIGGLLWDLKCRSKSVAKMTIHASVHEQHIEIHLEADKKRIYFSPQEVRVETEDGIPFEQRSDVRADFKGQSLRSPWSDAQVGYFNGYALWQYLTAPFLYSYPDFQVEEVAPWQEDEETWRVLKIVFPEHIVAHTRVQYAYYDSDGLLRRHQYTVDVMDGASGVNYAEGYQNVDGILVATRRRVYSFDREFQKIQEPLLVSIDIDRVELASDSMSWR